MGKSRAGARRQPDKVARLTAQVAELTARLEALEASPRASENGNGTGRDKAPQSRRDLLKLAGAAAAGAAGSIVLGAIPDFVHGTVENLLGGALLAVPHHGVDELLGERRII